MAQADLGSLSHICLTVRDLGVSVAFYDQVMDFLGYLRSKDDQNYEAVAATFADPDRFARRPEIAAGTFTLFKGDESLHRVSEIGAGSRRRMIALFSFDRRANQIYQQQYIDELRDGGA